jgi:hypothetical protein
MAATADSLYLRREGPTDLAFAVSRPVPLVICGDQTASLSTHNSVRLMRGTPTTVPGQSPPARRASVPDPRLLYAGT